MEEILRAAIPIRLKEITADDGTPTKYLDTLWGDVRFKSPKLIVALSVTDSRTYDFKGRHAIFPAILDTGFNRDFEICETQLYHRDVIKKNAFGSLGVMRAGDGRSYEESPAHIWLHRFEYVRHGMPRKPDPVCLTATKRIRVMKSSGDETWPPLPLLGLGALLANKLHVVIDPRDRVFKILR